MTGDFITEKRRIARTILDVSNEYNIDVNVVLNDVFESIKVIQKYDKNPRKVW